MNDLNDMLYFAEVVERGGFAAAGRALDIPKSRLSRRIAELEARLGVRLMQRTTRRLALTEIGEAYLRHCQAMRDAAQAAADTVAQVQTEPRGTVRVSCPITLMQTVLAGRVPQFLRQYPQVRLEVRVSNHAVNLLEEGIDVALRVRPSVEDSGSMVVKRLDVARSVLVAAPSVLQGRQLPQQLDDLQELPAIAMSAHEGMCTWSLVGPRGQSEQVQHVVRYVADDLLSLKMAALQGVGMCSLPDYMCIDALQDGRLLRLLPEWSQSPGIVHAVFPSRRGLSPAVRSFLDFLGESMPGTSAPLAQDGAFI
jgi:DNA-binding transcriptional LysR family regulator